MSEFVKFRNVDKNNDWCFGKGLQDYGNNSVSTANNIKTRIQSFKADCFFDVNAGIDWITLLSANNSKLTQDMIEFQLTAYIMQSLYVKKVNTLNTYMDKSTRELKIEYSVETIFDDETKDSITIGGANA